MEVRDSTLGKLGLVSTAGLFLLFCVWVNTYPFIDEESVVKWLVPSPVPSPAGALLGVALSGLVFVGGLMAFTLYHLYPHL